MLSWLNRTTKQNRRVVPVLNAEAAVNVPLLSIGFEFDGGFLGEITMHFKVIQIPLRDV